MDVANHIRQEEEESKKNIIIFVTGYEKYMNSAFDVSAFHYLLKPINEEKFRDVFGHALKEYLVNMEKIVSYNADTIKVANGDKLILAQKKYNGFTRQYMKYAKDGGIVNV